MHAYTGSGAAFRSERTFHDGRLFGTDLCCRTMNWIRAHYPEVPWPVHFQGHACLHIPECHHFPLRGARNADVTGKLGSYQLTVSARIPVKGETGVGGLVCR